jgi:uncharacterized membrane protein HdeD (DUF308 family)
MDAGNEFPVRIIGRESVGWTIAFGILLIVLGLLAIAVPLLAGVAVEAMFAWLLILGGVAHLALAWHVRGAGAHVWEALVGVAYIVAGIFLLIHPLAGLVALAVILGGYLLVKGFFEVMMVFRLRGVPGSGWLLVDAVVSLALAAMIWWHLPSAAEWVVGTLLGVAIVFSGVSRLALAMAARRVHAAA